MKTFLDNIPVAFPNNTLLEPKFSIRRSNENSEAAISFTGDLVFTNSDYDYIYNKLVTSVGAINKFIVLKFVDDCCNNKEYIFQIKPESLQWCNNSCEISANALEYSVDSAAYACINNTLIWDNWNGFQNKLHPRIAYCLEFRPSILQDAVIIVGALTAATSIFVFSILLIVQTIVNTINVVITAINKLGGNLSKITVNGSSGNMSLLTWAQDLQKTLARFIVGCNYDHPSPLVRDYTNNVCQKCGITFQSSILNDTNNDYFNLVYFSAQIRKGQSQGQYFGGLVNYIMRNKPIHNLKTFLDEVQQPFNARWDINNGILRFERRDFFKTQKPWLDLKTFDPKKIISVCYEWTKKPRNSYADISYSKDAMDWVGQEALERWSDIISWNPNKNTLQKGNFTRTFPFGAARFRGDGIDRDVLSDYKWMPFSIGKAIKDNEDVMLLNNGTAMLPKLLILRKGTDYMHALVENSYPTFVDPIDGYRETVYPNQPYNYPMWVREGQKNTLYQRFWEIENPNNASWSGYDVTVKIKWDCATLNSINIDGTILTDRGLADVETIDLDFETSTMIIKATL